MSRYGSKTISTALLAALLSLPVIGAAATKAPDSAAVPTTPVTPGFVITFERQTIRENDRIPVHIVLSNPSDKPLTDVTLRWNVPSEFLTLSPQSCTAAPKLSKGDHAASSFTWPTIPANQDPLSGQTRDFCLVSGTAGEDTFTLSFLLQYTWTEKGVVHRAVLTKEKPIKSAFLGSDTFAGVPLGLASLVIPGLLFWLILDAFQTPWRVEGGGLGDKLIYSVLVSLALIALFGHWSRLKPYFDVAAGLSMERVAMLALVGGICGGLVGGGDRAVRWVLANRSLHADDSDLVLFGKLLELNKGKSTPNTIVRAADGTQYRGSVGAQKDGETFLMGWYQIRKEPLPEPIRSRLDRLIARGEYAAALRVAMKNHVQVDTRDFVYRSVQGRAEDQTEAQMRVVKSAAEVPGPIDVRDTAPIKPLELV